MTWRGPDMGGGSTDAVLRRALSRAGAYGQRNGYARQVNSAEDGLRFVQAHIATTMLRRRLVFLIGGVARLRCDVAGCRLFRFAAIDASGAAGAEHVFEDLFEAAGVEVGLMALVQAISGPCETADHIALLSSPLTSTDEPARAGLPADRLLGPFGLADAPPEPEDRFRTFLETAQGAITAAALLRDDMLYAMKGIDVDVDDLAQFAETTLPNVEAWPSGLGGSLSGSGMLIVARVDVAEAGYLVAECGGDILLARVGSGAEPSLLQAWQVCMQG